ncbi:MAG: hypothetical protein LBI31_06870, partial [Zoogloeaceae bacterium]|nr:hypothetical protein [Zoogloeaceae bacterium]
MGLFFLLGFLLFSYAIVWSVIRSVEKDAEFHVYGVTAINEEKLRGLLSTTLATVVDAAASFESLDRLPEERRR